jgi:hypothetical protein
MSRSTIVRRLAFDDGKELKLTYEKTIEKIRFFAPFAVLLILILPTIALSTEYQRAEEIAPESAEDAPAGLEDIERVPRVRPVRTLLRDVLKDAPPFWRDSSFEMGIRGYDFQRENGIEPIAEATAVGTELAFRSGKWRDRVSTVISWHTSTGVDAPEARGGTGVLAPDQSEACSRRTNRISRSSVVRTFNTMPARPHRYGCTGRISICPTSTGRTAA